MHVPNLNSATIIDIGVLVYTGVIPLQMLQSKRCTGFVVALLETEKCLSVSLPMICSFENPTKIYFNKPDNIHKSKALKQ